MTPHTDRDVARHRVLLRAPPKAVFQMLLDPALIEEFTPWRLVDDPPEIAAGVTWTERRRLNRRTWHVTAFDRRGLSFTAESAGVRVTWAAKKGGPGSCNLQMHIEGDDRAVARFVKTDGDRLRRLAAWLDRDG